MNTAAGMNAARAGKGGKFTDLRFGKGTKKFLFACALGIVCYIIAFVAYEHCVNGMDLIHAFGCAFTGNVTDGASLR